MVIILGNKFIFLSFYEGSYLNEFLPLVLPNLITQPKTLIIKLTRCTNFSNLFLE